MNLKLQIANLSPKNRYKQRPYSVEVRRHAGVDMNNTQIDFISSVQQTPLDGVAYLLVKYIDSPAKLNLIKIAMLFHIYRHDFDMFLAKNKTDPKVKKASQIWAKLKSH
ncbi:hypothetical protein [Acinetobacter pollinis]|uniref:hypothetical protein n=1 Tax=Acinetobacter pollinis TaxID=2605270 RepID=UPI0018A29BEF|nr:hypothetical protein [Acinetobacter pollinis]MBF7690888.1 hypothetical protein [Acinetobacter pollinis]MBF7697366.1 hypothetical protein [Acinetobacter pollinis]